MDLRGRAKQRGFKLDEDCYKAKISKHEWGPDDKRHFCYGLVEMTCEEPLDKCKECGAWAFNAPRPK